MFYELPERMNRFLRLGDVVRGYISPSTTIKQPFLSFENRTYHNYDIHIEMPSYSVVLMPCCSIGEQQMICLTPLIQLQADFFKNKFFTEDFTRINREIEPIKAIPPDELERLTETHKREIESMLKSYALLSFFIYEPSQFFPDYEKRKMTTNYYMIDFKNVQTLKCELIRERNNSILESKCLQLSTNARDELRMKLSYYYGRVPEEDKILED